MEPQLVSVRFRSHGAHERRQRPAGRRPLDAALNSLIPHGPSHRKKRWVLPVGEQHPRPLDPTRRLPPAPADHGKAHLRQAPAEGRRAAGHAAVEPMRVPSGELPP
jgi:hypothetical protein